MQGLRVVTTEAFTLLRRDRVFLPAVIMTLVIGLVANGVSNWSIEEFSKVLYDFGFLGFQLIGGLVALFWGTKSITDTRQGGALETQLAWPIARSTWIVGKYLGLVLSLLLLAVFSLILWQSLMLLNDSGWMTPPALAAFGGLVLGWLVLGALGIFLGTMLSQAVATFAGILLWLLGLGSAVIANTLAPGTPEVSVRLVKAIARVWDLAQFNLVTLAIDGQLDSLQIHELWVRGAYGLLLILAMITAACIIFARRDGTA